jgi:hypothetical protein
MRIAVIFFGVARGMSVTIPSIKRRIYACNPAGEFSFHTLASLNLVERITNPRTGEAGVPLDPAEAFLLDADAYALVRQNDAAIAAALAAVKRQPDYFNNEWISVRNSLHQLASLRRAWRFCLDPGGFDYYLFLRPDLIYLDDIDLRAITSGFQGSGNIALPAWHDWGGFNDRLALADAAAARHYAARLDLVPEYCATTVFHPESFLAHALEQGGCRVGALPVKAKRVRADGAIVQEDFAESVADIPSRPRRFSMRAGQICFAGDEIQPAAPRHREVLPT